MEKEVIEEEVKEKVKKEEKMIEKPKENKITDNNQNKEDTDKKEKFKVVKDKKEDKKTKKEFDKDEYLKKKKRKTGLIIFIGILITLTLIGSVIFALINVNNDKIISGVYIEEIEMSGLTKEEAKAKLTQVYEEKKNKEINVKYEDFESILNPTILEVEYKIDEAIEEAYLTGRSNNIFINNYKILATLLSKKNINVKMEMNEEIARQSIQDMQVKLPNALIESSYSIEEKNLIITKGKNGVVINTEELLAKVKESLKKVNAKEEYVIIPVIEKEPTKIDIDKIHEEIYKEAKDAYYEKEPFKIYPEVEGIDFDIEEAKKILAEEKEEYIIPLKITKPKITINQIGTEAFPDRVGYFTTRFDPTEYNRTNNLVLACNKLNGKVVLPGEVFSYNKTLGPRTVATGYKNAKIYEAGKVVDGIGGGICQISTTLYNAVLESNLEIVERRNHQFVTSYIGPGRDATVVYGMTDFRFKNTRKYPVRITASAKNGIATVAIYGIKEENEYTFRYSTKQIVSIPAPVKYIEDPTLNVGEEVVEKKGVNGMKTETYITKMLNGKVISTKLLSRDTYDPMERIIRKGTKKVEQAPEPVVPQEPEKELEKEPEKESEKVPEKSQEESEEQKKPQDLQIDEPNTETIE